MILSKTRKEAKQYALLMEQRLEQQPQFQVELLYVPAIQSLLTQDHFLTEFTAKALKSLPVPEQWYQISLISIQQIFVVSRLIRAQEFEKAQAIMAHNSLDSIRFGYN
jgi:hypothetical protein